MKQQKDSSTVYNADGIDFTIYAITKQTKSGPKVSWVLEEYVTTGFHRLLNNKTLKAAKERADKIRAVMVKGQASRMSLSNGQWQDACIALEAANCSRNRIWRGVSTAEFSAALANRLLRTKLAA